MWRKCMVAGMVLAAACGVSGETTTPAVPDTQETQADQAENTAPVTLLELSGSGTKTTQSFSARGDWDLEWSYDCSSFGMEGNFIVSGQGFNVLGVNQLGPKGSGVEHYHDGGSGHLEIISTCDWTVRAVDV